MTEAEWLACTDPQDMLEFLRGKAGDRKLRLFALACCRRIWGWITHEDCRRAILVSEQYADGVATLEECDAAGDAVSLIADTSKDFVVVASSCAVGWATSTGPEEWDAATWSLRSAMGSSACHAALVHEDRSPEQAEQANCFRDIFGNPFRPVTLDRSLLTPAVTSLAQATYEDRDLPSGHFDPARLAVLSDALEEAGCNDAGLLEHLRSAACHVRGCWAVDLILGRY